MTTGDSPTPAPNYRALKATVIILGALILLAMGALVAGLIFGLGPKSPATQAGTPYEQVIAAPGQHIESTTLDGNRVLVRLSSPSGDELVILDAGTGRVIGRVAVKP